MHWREDKSKHTEKGSRYIVLISVSYTAREAYHFLLLFSAAGSRGCLRSLMLSHKPRLIFYVSNLNTSAKETSSTQKSWNSFTFVNSTHQNFSVSNEKHKEIEE